MGKPYNQLFTLRETRMSAELTQSDSTVFPFIAQGIKGSRKYEFVGIVRRPCCGFIIIMTRPAAVK